MCHKQEEPNVSAAVLKLIAVAFTAILVASCAGTDDGSPRPSVSPIQLRIEALPKAILLPSITLVCDPDPSQADSDAGESTVLCQEGAVLALQAMSVGGASAPDRLYLRRPTCSKTPCTPNELNTALVTGFSDGRGVTVAIDTKSIFVVATADDPAATWPPSTSSAPPSGAPIALEDAPADVKERESLPSCGALDEPDPAGDAQTCFRDAVVGGQPAELLWDVFSVEGEPVRWVLRFIGDGAITRYRRDESGAWIGEQGGMILDPGGRGFSFDVWAETQVRLE